MATFSYEQTFLYHERQDQGERERVDRGSRRTRPTRNQNFSRAVELAPVELHISNWMHFTPWDKTI